MATIEFCCRSGGSNMNGGGLASNAEPATTPVYSFTNGAWTTGTPHVYTPTSGNPSLTVTVGDWANVFIDGATTPVFIGKVTAVSSTTISVSATLIAGTAPITAGTGMSINVGGAWAGPSGAVQFPFNFVKGAMVTAATDTPRFNFKNNQTYSITAGISHTQVGPAVFQGYTTTFNDGGKATIDGGTTGASYVLAQNGGGNGPDRNWLCDLIFQNNGATGSQPGIQWGAGTRSGLLRVVVHAVRGTGIDQAGTCIECEAYACNQSNGSTQGGFVMPGSGFYFRCIAHNNTGSQSHGFYTQNPSIVMIECIADTNGGHGFWEQNITGGNVCIGCDFYNNGGDGYQHITSGISTTLINCNFVNNTGFGVNISSGNSVGYLMNCGFIGNVSGPKNGTGGLIETGTVTYASVPYNSAATGDFRISLAAAKGAGRGTFTETAPSYSGTVTYRDIGAAQHQDAGGSSGPLAQLKTFGRGSPY